MATYSRTRSNQQLEKRKMRSDMATLEDEAADGLSGTTWSFWFSGDRLVVDLYQTWTRPSRRHRPVVSEIWSRLPHRARSTLAQAQVPLTAAIAERAKAAWLTQLQASVGVGFQKR